jgi:Domain of unknown function (DUF4439)
MTVLQGWQQALASEQAAVFGYGQLGPHLSAGPQLVLARSSEQAHRAQAALASVALQALGGGPAESPAPSPPSAVSDDSSAVDLAVELEEATAEAWRFLLAALAAGSASGGGDSTAQSRVTAVAALTAAAVRAVQWRQLRSDSSPSVPFPGI